MKQKTTVKLIYAWTLLFVFTSVLLFKDFYYHNAPYHGSDKAPAGHNTSLKQVYNTCGFTVHESAEAKATVFQLVVAIS